MAHVRPIPATRHASLATFVHSDVFLRQDATRRVLEPPSPYSGPYQVMSRKEKTLQILVRGRPVTVSTDRVKPAYMLKETGRGTNTNLNPAADAAPTATPHAAPPPPVARTTRSGRHVRLPARFNIWATISAGVGGNCPH
jgi:hypothetical protein